MYLHQVYYHLFVSTTFITCGYVLSFSYQLLRPIPVSYSYQVLVAGSCYYSLVDISYSLQCQLFLSNSFFSYQFQVLLSGNITTLLSLILSANRITYFYQVFLSVTRIYSSRIRYSHEIAFVTNHFQLLASATPTRYSYVTSEGGNNETYIQVKFTAFISLGKKNNMYIQKNDISSNNFQKSNSEK